MIKQVTVDEKNYYKRLDKFLRNNFSELKLGTIFMLIRKGNVKINGKKAKQNETELFIGDDVQIFINDRLEDISRPEVPQFKPRYMDLKVLYEDEYIIAVDKPPKVSMHPGRSEEMVTLIEALIFRASQEYEPHLVHRLDKHTSGVVVVAKTKQIARELTEIIMNRETDKYYIALLSKNLKNAKGTLNSIVDEKDAALEYTVENVYKNLMGSFPLVNVHLLTGRKHQIRVQFSQISSPVLGDDIYGDKDYNRKAKNLFGLKRYFLHSTRLCFNYRGKRYDISSPLSNDLEQVLEKVENMGGGA